MYIKNTFLRFIIAVISTVIIYSIIIFTITGVDKLIESMFIFAIYGIFIVIPVLILITYYIYLFFTEKDKRSKKKPLLIKILLIFIFIIGLLYIAAINTDLLDNLF